MDLKKLNIIVLLLGLLAFWINGDNYAAAPMLIEMAKDLHVDISSASFSVTSYMLFFGLLTILFGPLGDRFGKTHIIKMAAFGSAVFSIISSFSNSLSFLILARAFNGAFSAGILPVSVAYIGENSPDDSRQNSIGKVMGLMFLGGAVAAFIGGALTYFGSWRLVYFIYGIAEFIIAFMLMFLLEKRHKGNAYFNFVRTYKTALSNNSLIKIISVMFCLGFAVLGSFVFLGKYIQNISNLNVMLIGIILSSYGIGTFLGGRISGSLRNRFGNKIFIAAGIIGGISLLILGLFYNLIFIVLALSGFGLSFIMLQSSFVTTAQEILPGMRGTVMSLASFSMVVSGAAGTFINSRIILYYSYSAIFIIAAVLLLSAGLSGYFVLAGVKRISGITQYEQSLG